MEALTRMVADSLARHGYEPRVSTHPVEWSRWFRCESSFSLLLVPSAPGVYSLGEEIVAPGELPGAKRMLAVFEVAETDDLCVALSRQFAPRSPLSARLSSGRCFVRFAQVPDADLRSATAAALNRWLAASSETATGLLPNNVAQHFGSARDLTAAPATMATAATSGADAPVLSPAAGENPSPAPDLQMKFADTTIGPPSLPAGF